MSMAYYTLIYRSGGHRGSSGTNSGGDLGVGKEVPYNFLFRGSETIIGKLGYISVWIIKIVAWISINFLVLRLLFNTQIKEAVKGLLCLFYPGFFFFSMPIIFIIEDLADWILDDLQLVSKKIRINLEDFFWNLGRNYRYILRSFSGGFILLKKKYILTHWITFLMEKRQKL